MSLSLGRRLLRLLDPNGERERMAVREARCMVEANADDLVRTITTSREHVQEMLRKHAGTGKPVNGKGGRHDGDADR
jgi:hypothetical protein